jgi:hypothetical protein
MPRVCTVCSHPQRREIDECLVSGQSNRGIAKRFGLDDAAVFRHRNAHLPAALTRAAEAETVARADDLLAQVRDLQQRALAILEQAESDGDARTALLAVREARGNLELLASLLGELSRNARVSVGVMVGQPLSEAVYRERSRRLADRVLGDTRLTEAAHDFLAAVEKVEMEVPDTWRG